MTDSISGAGRYAPTPSGDLHLGNLRTALLAWLFARSTGRRFLLRIDDLDRERDAGAAPRQLADLRAIDLDWDDTPVRQSDRGGRYAEVLAELAARDLVYECTCTRREILEAPSAPHAPPGAYPGTCRDRTSSERAAARAAIAPRLPALRLRTRTGDGVLGLSFTDLFGGQISGLVDDFVLQRGDGAVAYNLAVVVDDADSGVDQVVRGDDLASSTPRQLLLQLLLGLPTPEYAHVPLVLNAEGVRLAKRDGAVTLALLAEAGLTAAEVRGVLAASLGLAAPGERVSSEQLLRRFDPDALPRSPWIWSGR